MKKIRKFKKIVKIIIIKKKMKKKAIFFILITLTTSSVTQLKTPKTIKSRNLSHQIYENLSQKLTHLMNKRSEKYPSARVLTHSQINPIKALDVHSKNPIYGFFWDKNNKFTSYHHAPHFRGNRKNPKVLPDLFSRSKPREIVQKQMDCVLSTKIGKMRFNNLNKWTNFRLVFRSNCMDNTFFKYFIVKETFHKAWNLNFQINGGNNFRVNYYRQYKCCDKGEEVLNMYKLKTFYTAKVFRLKAKHRYKIFGKPEKPSDWEYINKQKKLYGRNLALTLLRKMKKDTKGDFKEKKDVNFEKGKRKLGDNENLAKLGNLTKKEDLSKSKSKNLTKKEKRELKLKKKTKNLKNDLKSKKRKLAPADLEALIPGYEHDPLYAGNMAWQKFDGLQWKLANHDFEIISASGSAIWNFDVLQRLWNGSNPETTCTLDKLSLTIECKF